MKNFFLFLMFFSLSSHTLFGMMQYYPVKQLSRATQNILKNTASRPDYKGEFKFKKDNPVAYNQKIKNTLVLMLQERAHRSAQVSLGSILFGCIALGVLRAADYLDYIPQSFFWKGFGLTVGIFGTGALGAAVIGDIFNGVRRDLESNTAIYSPQEKPQGFHVLSAKQNHANEKKEEILKACASCKKIERKMNAFKRCSNCKQVHYCSQDCQKKDWNKHKSQCKGKEKK